MRCKYCFHTKNPHDMSLETAKRAADFVAENADGTNALPTICFFGGEPMLRYEEIVKPLTEYIRSKYGSRFGLSMTTNGTLLTQEVCDFIQRNNISILISADGGELTQNYNRPYASGGCSFAAMSAGAKNILRHYPMMKVRMTLLPATIENFFDDLKSFNDVGFKRMVAFPDAGAEWTDEAKRIAENEVRKYADYVIERFRKSEFPFALHNMIATCLPIFTQKFAEREEMIVVPDTRCGTGCNHAAGADYLGNIYTCHRFTTIPDASKFVIGDVFDGVDEARRIEIEMQLLADRISGTDCAHCLLSNSCNGICLAENYGSNGQLYSVSPVSCWWAQVMASECLRVMNTLGDERNEMFRESLYRVLRGEEFWG